MQRYILFLLIATAVMASHGCVESVTRIHDRSEGDKALYQENDPNAAVLHYEKAAYAGDAEAQHKLAVMYLNGEGLKKDAALFWDLEKKSAAQGYPPAMRTLGFFMVTGLEGVKADPQKGMSLLTAAANEDDANAHYLLGIIYSRGTMGVERNCRRAAYHYSLAEENGFHINPELTTAASLESMDLKPLPAANSGTSQAQSKIDLNSLEARKQVQIMLKDLGYYKMGIDGAIGKGSIKAIKAFQKDAGMKQTGIIDEQLFDSLLAARKSRKNP